MHCHGWREQGLWFKARAGAAVRSLAMVGKALRFKGDLYAGILAVNALQCTRISAATAGHVGRLMVGEALDFRGNLYAGILAARSIGCVRNARITAGRMSRCRTPRLHV